MAKKTAPEAGSEQKVMTKYDRKMEERRKQKEKDKRQEKITKIVFSMLGIMLVAAIVISVAASIITKQIALKGTYIQVGDHKITRLEYDYYFNSTVNAYLTSMSAYMPVEYLGLDTTRDFAEQQYSEDMTWKDMFDQMTVEQIRQMKAMTDDAKKNGFTYDDTEDYANVLEQIEAGAADQGVGVSEYYRSAFGSYATAKNIEPFAKDSLMANAYYQDLLEKNMPSDEEVKAYYEEHKTDYDKVDYRSFTFTTGLDAEATEEEVAEAVKKIKADANAMADARREGTDFNELCLTYASEDMKANYEDPENDYSLAEGRYRGSIPTLVADWLYEDGRKAGDVTVIEDADSNRYYVAEYLDRYYDEADDERIANLIASDIVSDYRNGLVEDYQVTDTKGRLNYLTIPEKEEETDETGAESPEDSSEADTSDAGSEPVSDTDAEE